MVIPFFGVDYKRSEFLSTVKCDYGIDGDTYKFDFTNITDEEQTALYKMITHVRNMRTEWTHMTPFHLDKGDEITLSWKYEYAIFELVRIYKTFNWKKNIMVYYGY